MGLIFKDNHFAFQALRVLSAAPAGQADICEVISTCKKIEDGNCTSWCSEWTKIADAVRKHGEKNLEEKFTESASQCFMRASNYYRAAEFYLNDRSDKNLMIKLDTLCTQCFNLGIKYGQYQYNIKPVEIPFEKASLPGHFYKSNLKKPSPTVLVMSGFDGTKEELYAIGISALKRGMNCLAFEGPGQGETLRRRNLPFRYNYETVVKPVIDFAIQNPDVDPKKLILWGESMGGYLAPRAAAFEHRLAACIANGGIFDYIGYKILPDISAENQKILLNLIRSHSDEFNKIAKMLMRKNVGIDWGVRHGLLSFNVKTPTEYVLNYEPYRLEGIASKITCPTLVIDNENESNFPRQAKMLYNELTCPKEYLMFKQEEGCGIHCEIGGRTYANDRIFNWIEKTLNASHISA